ncbi:DUF3794 domain-containing protein [Lutispora sp.]|uniref:DUF3794 domain-containing protein n=1 Tax=Lutispora sp. TaxID=2828727 RepID=UPI002B212BC0|nr:DUF3794 domain-containing protein [Lutispora sp.]MEA4961500.1 DUF3794 domain-containing protein [Lutispora sp.]
MVNHVNDLIEYAGIADVFPHHPTAFKQFSVQETVCLPIAKPNIEQIIKVMAELAITSTRVIRTPGAAENPAVSLEGQRLTGWKLIVEGEVRQKIEYVADEPSQPVYAAHFNMPFCTFIVLGRDYAAGSPLIVTGYIEDIFAKQINKRCIFKNITILVTAE